MVKMVKICWFCFRNRHVKISNYVETVVSRYTDESFRSHFRVSRTLCGEILTMFARPIRDQTDLPPDHQVLLSLWGVIGNLDSFREVGDRFGVTKSTAWEVFMNFCTVCTSRTNEFITWPENLAKTKSEFEKIAGFPGVVGCVDGSHIPIPVPQEHGYRYINRKGFASMNLAVCDSDLKFTYVNVGWPGSVHDARVYRNTLQPVLEEQEEELLAGGYLLGDAAFPVATYLQPPFRDNGHLTTQQRAFNTKLSPTRMSVERSFGRLKCKFRRLQKLDMSRVDLMTNVFTTACVLHNLAIHEEQTEEADDTEDTDAVTGGDDDEGIADLADDAAKRQQIIGQIAR